MNLIKQNNELLNATQCAFNNTHYFNSSNSYSATKRAVSFDASIISIGWNY